MFLSSFLWKETWKSDRHMYDEEINSVFDVDESTYDVK